MIRSAVYDYDPLILFILQHLDADKKLWVMCSAIVNKSFQILLTTSLNSWNKTGNY